MRILSRILKSMCKYTSGKKSALRSEKPRVRHVTIVLRHMLTLLPIATSEKYKSNHKWLRGGVEFIDEVPKSASGKILRRKLRDQEKEKNRKQGAKL